MDRKEAIKIIKERYEFWQKHYAEECKDYGEALGMAIAALEEKDHRCSNCRHGDYAQGNVFYCLAHSSFHDGNECCSEWEEEQE